MGKGTDRDNRLCFIVCGTGERGTAVARIGKRRNQVLVSAEGYEGKYVALRSVSDRMVVASGDDPEAVMQEARERGATHPVLFFVPGHDLTLAY